MFVLFAFVFGAVTVTYGPKDYIEDAEDSDDEHED